METSSSSLKKKISEWKLRIEGGLPVATIRVIQQQVIALM